MWPKVLKDIGFAQGFGGGSPRVPRGQMTPDSARPAPGGRRIAAGYRPAACCIAEHLSRFPSLARKNLFRIHSGAERAFIALNGD
jgi:hypothetical protein